MASFQSWLSVAPISKSLGREANQIEGPALLTGIKSPLCGRSPGFRVKRGFESLIRCVTALGSSSTGVNGPVPRLLRTQDNCSGNNSGCLSAALAEPGCSVCCVCELISFAHSHLTDTVILKRRQKTHTGYVTHSRSQ